MLLHRHYGTYNTDSAALHQQLFSYILEKNWVRGNSTHTDKSITFDALKRYRRSWR
jgi:hypothetical protein